MSTDDRTQGLPERAIRAAPVGQEAWPFPKVDYYTADQMREHAAAAIALERDRLAVMAERMTQHSRLIRAALNGEPIAPCEIAAAIRKGD